MLEKKIYYPPLAPKLPNVIFVFLDINMAGLAPEGSQFDARQYDAKMSDL